MPKPRKWKRGRPKKSRAGCLMCKPWKANGANMPDRQERVWRAKMREVLDTARSTPRVVSSGELAGEFAA